MRYVLDSNVILFYIGNTRTKQFIEETYGPFKSGNTAIISIATVAEIMSTAKERHTNKFRFLAASFTPGLYFEINHLSR